MGWDGACTIFDEDGKYIDSITFKKSKKYHMIDGNDLYEEINKHVSENEQVRVVIEMQHTKQKEKGKKTNILNVGVILATIARFNIAGEITEVAPITWQKFFNVYGRTKKVISDKAVERGYPKDKTHTPRGRLLDGNTDSYLIGYWFYKMTKMQQKMSK